MQRRPYMVQKKATKPTLYEKRAKGAIGEMEHHLSMIFAICLLDKLEWGPRKIGNCTELIYKQKEQVLNGLITMPMIDTYLVKKGININKRIVNIPLRTKLAFAGVEKRGATYNIIDFMNVTLHDVYAFFIPVLKVQYKLSNAKIEYLLDEMEKYMDSYAKGYVDDAGIVEAFKITTRIDINTGKKITEEEWQAIQ